MICNTKFHLCKTKFHHTLKKWNLNLQVTHSIVSSVLPILNLLFVYNGIDGINICINFNVPFAFEKAFFYPLIGYYLEHNINVTHLKQKQILGMLIVVAVGILFSNICTYVEGVLNGSYTQNYVQLFDYVTAIVAYIVIKYMVIKNNELLNGKSNDIICKIGSLTMGIYLMDPILRVALYRRVIYLSGLLLPDFFATVNWILISMVCGGIATLVLKRIPVINKVI